ncbi:hypothetical protein CRUP_038580, partial [Coryphaenoides rupestris]
QTKPLSFADCIGDELPVGWEEAYDPVVGAYYVDHNTKSTQLEDPRALWQQEQEVMLREYLQVAHHALSAQEEIYQVKQERLLLAQQEYQLLHDTWRNKSTSQTSLNSRSSSSSRYDPEILKAEIVTARSRVKVSGCPQGYQPQEAQAILKEVRSLRDAISSGEKEKQLLIQSRSCGAAPGLWPPQSCLYLASTQRLAPRQTSLLRVSSLEVQIAGLDSEAWPGLLDPERDRLILINEKEELLKELSYARPPRHLLPPSHAQRIESQKRRLEEDLQEARHTQSKALTER